MTTRAPKNSTELPISLAVAALRDLYVRQSADVQEAIQKLEKRYAEKLAAILCRVPEELREHVKTKASETSGDGAGADAENSSGEEAAPRGVTPYEPGPAARAATGRRS